MRKRLAREVVLLCLPVLLVGGMGWLVQTALRPRPIHAVEIGRLKVAMFAADNVQLDLTLQWKPSFFDRRTDFPVDAKGWLLDADGKLVALQDECDFQRWRISEDEWMKDQWYIHPYFENLDHKVKSFKEPLTFQGWATIDNSPPFKWSYRVPTGNYEETPRSSIYPFRVPVISPKEREVD